MMLRNFNTADEVFYWGRTGTRATVIEIKCTLKETVNADKLKNAFEEALKIHTNFRIRPVIYDGRVKASVSDVEKVPLFPENDIPKHIGSPETDGFMLYCAYSEKDFAIHIFHGISDLRGISHFLNTMLMYYFSDNPADITIPYVTDTMPVYEKIMENGESFSPKGRYNAEERNVFRIPETRFSDENTKQHLFEIDIPIQPLLALSKSCESSVFPVLQTMIGRGLRNAYEVGDMDIAGYASADLRPIFKVESGGNSASTFVVPYTSKLDKHDFKERAKLLRQEMMTQVKPDNLFVGISQNITLIGKVSSLPQSIEETAHMAVSAARDRDDKNNTYGLSYTGHISFGENIDKHIKSVTACAGSYSYPVWIMACEFNGILRLTGAQSFDSDTAVRAVFDEIKEHIPEAELFDHGIHYFDECHLKEFEHIN